MVITEGEEAHIGEVFERLDGGFKDTIVSGLTGGSHSFTVANEDVHVLGGFSGEHVLHECEHLTPAGFQDHFQIRTQHQHCGFPIIVAGYDDIGARLIAGKWDFDLLLVGGVFRIAFRCKIPCLVRLDKRYVKSLNAGNAVHFPEVGLQIDFVEAEGAFFDVAKLQFYHGFLVGAERALDGQLE